MHANVYIPDDDVTMMHNAKDNHTFMDKFLSNNVMIFMLFIGLIFTSIVHEDLNDNIPNGTHPVQYCCHIPSHPSSCARLLFTLEYICMAWNRVHHVPKLVR